MLDTQLLLWALSAPSKLLRNARQRIDSNEVFVSAASIWEISIKSALGKLDAHPAEVLAGIEPAGFSHLAVSGEHAARVKDLPQLHRDQFDRMLVAQASIEPMILLTNDRLLKGYGEFIEIVC